MYQNAHNLTQTLRINVSVSNLPKKSYSRKTAFLGQITIFT